MSRDFRTGRSTVILLISVFLVISSVAGFFHYGVLYYFLLGFLALMFLFQSNLNVGWGIPTIAFFLFICAFSLIANDPPAYFNAWNRFFVYTLVVLIVSPLITNMSIGKIRSQVFYYSLCTLAALSVGSFFAYYLGINMFVRDGSELEIGVGTFSGLMNHSMVLGPFAAISAVFLFGQFLFEQRRFLRFLFLCSSIFCMGASLLASSRIAVLAGIASVIILILRYFKGNLTKSLSLFLVIIVIATASFPIWAPFTDFVVAKNEANIVEGSVLYSRQRKITARITEFKSSPLFGIGFCTVDPRYDVVQVSNGQIEPGSSWLAVLSMTGILGLIAFSSVCIKAFKQAWNTKDRRKASVLSAILFFYLVHMLAEGYIMAPRSFLGMFFWLLIGTINASYLEEE